MNHTICHAFLATTERSPDRIAVRHRRGPAGAKAWTTVTWREYRRLVERVAAGLVACGVRSGDRVAILSGTRWEWAVADLAIMGIGAATVPIYQNASPADAEFILSDSDCDVLFCETRAKVERFMHRGGACPRIRMIVQIDEIDPPAPGGAALSWADFLDRGASSLAADPDLYRTLTGQRTLADLATLVYTSGTTGQPKGAVLTHEQLMSAFVDVAELDLTERDVSLTFLPFAHIAGRVEHFAHVYVGFCMGFAESIERLRENFLDVRPTFIAAVPRLFEKLYDAMTARADANRLTRRIFAWAVGVGRAVSDVRAAGGSLPVGLGVKCWMARRLVFDRLASRLGGRLRFAISGGAPLSVDLLRFFHGAGLMILEGYGLTETTAAVVMNSVRGYRFGWVGRCIGDVQIRIAADGEIFVKSAQVMKAYHNNPGATHDVLSADGWFATGDIGEVSGDGYLKITDRKKDLIKTAGGKYVAPQKLESLLRASRYVSNVLVHGDARRCIVALITANVEEVQGFLRERGLLIADPGELVNHPHVRRLFDDVVAQVNAGLAGFETIKNFAMLPRDFTVDAGELTPSMKIRRRVCDQRYADVLEGLYQALG